MLLVYWLWGAALLALFSFLACVLFGLTGGRARIAAFILLALTLILTLTPGLVRGIDSTESYGRTLLWAASLCLGAALICLARMRRRVEPAWLPVLAIAAGLHLWVVLVWVLGR